MDDDMSFVEGTFRIDDGEWQVLIVSKRDIEEPVWVPMEWESGVRGFVFTVPRAMRLDMSATELLLLKAVGCGNWQRVRGPDSIMIR